MQASICLSVMGRVMGAGHLPTRPRRVACVELRVVQTDVLDKIGNPAATTIARVQNAATGDFEIWITDRKYHRQIPYRFEQYGYVPVRNGVADDGLWRINEKRQVVYAKASLSLRERLKLLRNLPGQIGDVGEVSDLPSPL